MSLAGQIAYLLASRHCRRTLITGALSSLLSASTGLTAFAQLREPPPSFRSGRFQFTMLRPLRPLPSIRLQRIDGAMLDLSSLRGAPILLNFWATWCAACRAEIPMLDEVYTAYQSRGLRVLAVSEDRGSRSQVEQFVRRLNIKALPIYVDPNGDVAHSDRDNVRNAPFALYGMPISYLITRSGLIVGYMPGAADWTAGEARELLDYLDRA